VAIPQFDFHFIIYGIGVVPLPPSFVFGVFLAQNDPHSVGIFVQFSAKLFEDYYHRLSPSSDNSCLYHNPLHDDTDFRMDWLRLTNSGELGYFTRECPPTDNNFDSSGYMCRPRQSLGQ
jgi:hypothetical protein